MQNQVQRESFVFSGRGGEYFRIWIVNLLLTIVTLGIYGAWAKVRRMQYFYRNTSVAGSSFDYHGDPKAILKGRIIALVLFGSYSAAGQINPIAAIGIFGIIMLVMPWLVVRSLRFRLHNTSYRGLRFAFHGKVGDGYANFLLMPIVSYVTLGLLWPLAHQQITRYTRNNSAFGTQSFQFGARAGQFYKPYLALFGIMLLLMMLAGLAVFGLISALSMTSFDKTDQNTWIAITVIGLLTFYLLLFLFARPYITSRLQNLIWGHTTLDALGFESTLRARSLLWITLSNAVLILFTVGLFKPFADIRMARYRIGQLALVHDGDINQFMAAREAEIGAMGEETADIFDMDIAL